MRAVAGRVSGVLVMLFIGFWAASVAAPLRFVPGPVNVALLRLRCAAKDWGGDASYAPRCRRDLAELRAGTLEANLSGTLVLVGFLIFVATLMWAGARQRREAQTTS